MERAYQLRWREGLRRLHGVVPADELSLIVCITRAMWVRNGHVFPRFAYSAYRDKDGMLYADFASGPREDQKERRKCIGNYKVVRDTFRALADALKLSDEDRIALFADLRKWVSTDDYEVKP